MAIGAAACRHHRHTPASSRRGDPRPETAGISVRQLAETLTPQAIQVRMTGMKKRRKLRPGGRLIGADAVTYITPAAEPVCFVIRGGRRLPGDRTVLPRADRSCFRQE